MGRDREMDSRLDVCLVSQQMLQGLMAGVLCSNDLSLVQTYPVGLRVRMGIATGVILEGRPAASSMVMSQARGETLHGA